MKSLFLVLSALSSIALAKHPFSLYLGKAVEKKSHAHGAPAWPPINVPENFELSFKLYTYSDDTHTLDPFKNGYGFQWVDSVKNRELTVLHMDGDQSDFFFDTTAGNILYQEHA